MYMELKRKKKLTLILSLGLIVLAGIIIGFFAILYAKNGSQSSQNDLIIYSPHPRDMTEYIVREFRQRTGINVTVITGGTGSLIEKLIDPSEQQNADIFWGGGIESLETVKEYFQEYISAEQSSIESAYLASHRLWSPFSVLPIVIIYNTKLVSESLIPDSWTSLLNPYFKDHLILANPEIAGSGFTILVTMLHTMAESAEGGAENWPFVRSLMEQLGHGGLVSSSTTVYNAVSEGEYFAGVTFENSVLSLITAGKNVGYRYPVEGTSAVPDGIALLKDAPHAAEAKRFIDFVLGRDVQSVLMTKWFRRSVRNDVPSYTPSLSELNIIQYPIADSAERRNQILSRWSQEYQKSRP